MLLFYLEILVHEAPLGTAFIILVSLYVFLGSDRANCTRAELFPRSVFGTGEGARSALSGRLQSCRGVCQQFFCNASHLCAFFQVFLAYKGTCSLSHVRELSYRDRRFCQGCESTFRMEAGITPGNAACNALLYPRVRTVQPLDGQRHSFSF